MRSVFSLYVLRMDESRCWENFPFDNHLGSEVIVRDRGMVTGHSTGLHIGRS